MSAPAAIAAGIVLSDDLMFVSRITGTARDLGLTVKTARSADVLLMQAAQVPPACLILDLANPGLKLDDLIKALREKLAVMPRLIAYGSHVDAVGLRAAREAGCDEVMPRSQFVQELPTRLPAWLSRAKPVP